MLKFRFSAGGAEIGGFDMKVLELDPRRRVLWQVIDGPAEWIGTKVGFDLQQSGDHVIVRNPRSSTKGGKSPWSSCTTAAPNGQSI